MNKRRMTRRKRKRRRASDSINIVAHPLSMPFVGERLKINI